MNAFRRTFLVVIILLFSLKSHGQDVGDLIKFKYEIPVVSVESIIDSKVVTNKFNILQRNIKFVVIEKSDSMVKVRALNYTPFSEQYQEKWKLTHGGEERLDYSKYYNNKIYTVKKSDFDLSAETIKEKNRLSVGLLTLPFKARPQDDFTFDLEFNLSSTLNVAIKYFGDYSLNLQLGAGIGAVGLNSSNATGITEGEEQDVATLTFVGGLMLEHNKLQVGIYSGVDHINNQKNFGWQSNGNLWLGFGIGYNLFDVAVAKVENKQTISKTSKTKK